MAAVCLFKQTEMFLRIHSHQFLNSGLASTCLTTSVKSQEGKSSEGGHQSSADAALAQD